MLALKGIEAKYTLFLLRHVHVLSNDDDCSLGVNFQSFVNANSWQVTNVFPICNMVRCHAALSFRSSTRSYYKEAVILMFSSSCTTRQAWLYWLELNWSQVGWIYSRNSWIHIRCSDMFGSLSDMSMDTSLLVYIISYRRHHSSRAFEEDTIRSVLQIIWCFVSSYC